MNALELLRSTLDGTETEDYPYRHDLRKVRDLARSAIAAAAAISAAVGSLPDEIEQTARALDRLITQAPERTAEIADGLRQFRQEVATFVILDGGAALNAAPDIEAAATAARVARATAEQQAVEIGRLLDGAQRLVGQSADDQLARHYREQANAESKAADSWRARTLGSFAATLGFGVVTTLFALLRDPAWAKVLGTGSMSFALGALTTYLGTQAKLHRGRETTYRQAELKLAVVTPMLDSIGPDERDQVRADVIKLVFDTEPTNSL
jgi:hypothetical protein